MNVLILGGLLLIAAAAIIGAILLGVSEQRAEARRHSSQQPPLSPAGQQPLVTRQLGDEVAASSPVPSPQAETTTALARGVEATEEGQMLPSLNGQVHELAGEVRALHQQAWQLEQRLSVLTEVLEQMENASNEHLRVEEGPHPHPTDRTRV
jgi:hypothetical protein